MVKLIVLLFLVTSLNDSLSFGDEVDLNIGRKVFGRQINEYKIMTKVVCVRGYLFLITHGDMRETREFNFTTVQIFKKSPTGPQPLECKRRQINDF